MEVISNKLLDLPSNYVTINDLKKRWLENKEKENQTAKENTVFTEDNKIFKSKNTKKKCKKNKTLVQNIEKESGSVWVKKSVVDNREISDENNSSKYRKTEIDRKLKNVNLMVEIEEELSDSMFDRMAEINGKYRNVNDENSSGEINGKFRNVNTSDANSTTFNLSAENNTSKFKGFNQSGETDGEGDLTAEIVSKFRVFELKDGKEKNDPMAENGPRFKKGFRLMNLMAEIGDFSSNDKNKGVIGSVLNDQMVEINDFGSGKKGSEISKRNEGFSKNVVGDLMAEYEKKDDPMVQNRDLKNKKKRAKKRGFNKNLKGDRIAEKGQKYVEKSVLENPKHEFGVKISDFMGENESKIGDLRKNDKNESTSEMAGLKSSDKKKGGKNRGFKKNFKMAEKGQIYVDKSVLENSKADFGVKNGDSMVENEWKNIGKEENDDIDNKKILVPENKLIDPTAEVSDLKNDVKKTRVRNWGFKRNLKMVEKVQIYVEKSVLENPKGENGDFMGAEKKVGEKKGFGKKSVGDRTKGLMDVRKIVLGDPSGENENVSKNPHFSTNKEKGGEEKGYKKGENSGFRGLKNVDKGKVKKGVDSGLVWVRKEEKSDDVCVAGNCCEGVLAKAGENEKKPCRGRQ